MLNIEDPTKVSNYDTDLFTPLIEHAARILEPWNETLDEEKGLTLQHYQASLRILADHSRAATFLVGDEVVPSNEGRGYVLRKIIRRAVRHARMFGVDRPFLFEMAQAVASSMGDAYPQLVDSPPRLSDTIRREEMRFAHTIDIGSWRRQPEDELIQQKQNAVPNRGF